MLHLSALLAMGIAAAPVTPPGVSLAAEGESPTWAARAELVGMQTLHGMTEGLLLAGLIQGDNGLGAALAVMGGAAGGVSTWLLTRNGVSGGPAAAINSGLFWGVSEALLFVLLRDDTLSFRNPVHMATGIAFTIALTGLGALVASEIRPNAGWVALTNSMGFWSALVVGALVLPISVELRNESLLYGSMLAAANAGLVGGALLGSGVRMSRLRVFLLDVGGVLGSLFGFAVSFVVAQGFSLPAVGVSSALGAAAGIGMAAYLTRGMDKGDAPKVALMPLVGDTRGLAFAVQF